MPVSNYTEDFFDALSMIYYGDEADRLGEYLRGECRMLLLFYLNLDENESVQPGFLAERLGVTTARVASILKTLENKGMIERHNSTEDKRKVFVSMTDKGRKYIAEKWEYINEFFDHQFEKLTENERLEYIRITKKLASDDGNNGK